MAERKRSKKSSSGSSSVSIVDIEKVVKGTVSSALKRLSEKENSAYGTSQGQESSDSDFKSTPVRKKTKR